MCAQLSYFFPNVFFHFSQNALHVCLFTKRIVFPEASARCKHTQVYEARGTWRGRGEAGAFRAPRRPSANAFSPHEHRSVGFSIKQHGAAGEAGRASSAGKAARGQDGSARAERAARGPVGAGPACPEALACGPAAPARGRPHQGPSHCTFVLGMLKSQCAQNHLAKRHRGVHSL